MLHTFGYIVDRQAVCCNMENRHTGMFDFAFSMSEIGVMPPARWLVLRDATTLHDFAPTAAAVAHPVAAPCSRARRW